MGPRGASGATVAPRIGVAALNPHAGEGGLLGDEEVRIIRPAIEAAAAEGIAASGPHPADHVFRRARAGDFDVIVSMYHDQAQIATKLLGFERGVSVGVGYPFVLVTPPTAPRSTSQARALPIPGQCARRFGSRYAWPRPLHPDLFPLVPSSLVPLTLSLLPLTLSLSPSGRSW